MAHPQKTNLHPRNLHNERYEFKTLIEVHSELEKYVLINKFGDESIDFFDPNAVKTLNSALLQKFYNIKFWNIPENYLCPPIPGRADYIHYVADLLAESNNGTAPTGNKINCLDIGVGANCVYPIIANQVYGWSVVGSDIDPIATISAQQIVDSNQLHAVQIRIQPNKNLFFEGIIQNEEYFDVCLCNPPFHASQEEAEAGSRRKLSNLKGKRVSKITLNFGGNKNELWCEGGELSFIKKMITESREFQKKVRWFTCIVSKESNLHEIGNTLERVKVKTKHIIDMSQGNKISRFVAWSWVH